MELPAGYKVEYTHNRLYEHLPRGMSFVTTLSAKGGSTKAEIFDGAGVLVTTGVAACSIDENYNKKIGRNVSLGRALKSLELIKAITDKSSNVEFDGAKMTVDIPAAPDTPMPSEQKIPSAGHTLTHEDWLLGEDCWQF
jgi:hypothetical protein